MKIHYWKKWAIKNTLCGVSAEYAALVGSTGESVSCKRCKKSHKKRVREEKKNYKKVKK